MNREIVLGIAAIAVGVILQMYSEAMREVQADQVPRTAAPARQVASAP